MRTAVNGFGRIGKCAALEPLAAPYLLLCVRLKAACIAVGSVQCAIMLASKPRHRRNHRRCCHHPLLVLPSGRLAFRIAFDTCPELELVHINEPTVIESSAYLLKYDSIHGAWGQGGGRSGGWWI